jgi:hypothetical protein
MTAYRFRVTLPADPTAFWRDVVIGDDRLLTEFQAAIDEAVGLNRTTSGFSGSTRTTERAR